MDALPQRDQLLAAMSQAAAHTDPETSMTNGAEPAKFAEQPKRVIAAAIELQMRIKRGPSDSKFT
jgi:hypothetical protein